MKQILNTVLLDISQGNYLIKRQHIFAYVSAHAAYISVSKSLDQALFFQIGHSDKRVSFFGRFGKSLICAYVSATF